MRGEPYLIKGGIAVDDRGTVTFCNAFDMTEVKRFYMLENHEIGFVRAWHGHLEEAKWITVLSGAAIVAVAPMKDERSAITVGHVWGLGGPRRYILYADGSVLFVPPGYANGHKNLVAGTKVMHFSNKRLEEADDYRFDWRIYGNVWEVEQR